MPVSNTAFYFPEKQQQFTVNSQNSINSRAEYIKMSKQISAIHIEKNDWYFNVFEYPDDALN